MRNLGAQLWMVRTPYGLAPEGGTLSGPIGQTPTRAPASPVLAGLGGMAFGFALGWFVFSAAR